MCFFFYRGRVSYDFGNGCYFVIKEIERRGSGWRRVREKKIRNNRERKNIEGRGRR